MCPLLSRDNCRGNYPDDSPGDVIHAEKDGTITLDDSITTWNPMRALAHAFAEVERLTAERDEWKRGAISWTEIAGGHKAVADDERARAEAAEREVERLTAELAPYEDMDEHYLRLQNECEEALQRAEAAEALAERRLADLRTYWTHCGYPEWYGDEERAWLHAALTDAGRDADGDGDAA